jgi:hypothetical protein
MSAWFAFAIGVVCGAIAIIVVMVCGGVGEDQ